jgi:hypothetical protein
MSLSWPNAQDLSMVSAYPLNTSCGLGNGGRLQRTMSALGSVALSRDTSSPPCAAEGASGKPNVTMATMQHLIALDSTAYANQENQM